jgi:hypothetical protein
MTRMSCCPLIRDGGGEKRDGVDENEDDGDVLEVWR